jgi:hypothetical protein
LAVIVRDSESIEANLDGKHNHKVGKAISQLRKDLWKKHFGMSQSQNNGAVAPFAVSENFLNEPAAESTWSAIQEQATSNSKGYEESFNFIPQNFSQVQMMVESTTASDSSDKTPASIWPTWTYRLPKDHKRGGKLVDCLPHEEAFWDSKTWAGVRMYKAPKGIQGFITALPTHWTKGENNDSGLNLTIIAHNEKNKNAVHLADVNEASSGTEHSS